MQYDVSKKERKVMPMSALVDNYTKKELEQIVNSSNSMKEVIEKLGYKTCKGVNYKTVQNTFCLQVTVHSVLSNVTKIILLS